MLSSCEFCAEFQSTPESRFHRVYGAHLNSRIVLKSRSFAVLPTIGQLFKGSLLIVPELHIETLSMLKSSELVELEQVVMTTEKMIGSFGRPLIYEHGARMCTSSGCGIYHAHLHVIPVPRTLRLQELSLGELVQKGSLTAALLELHSAPQYLLCRDTEHNLGFVLPATDDDPRFRSQFMRRHLARLFSLQNEWDWRLYKSPENWLIETVRSFRI